MESNSLLLNGEEVKRSLFSKYELLDQENKLLKARVKELEEELLESRRNLQEAKHEKRVEKALEHTASVQKKIHSKSEPKRKQMDEGKVMALRRAGWTYEKIANEMGYSYSGIYFAVKKITKRGEIIKMGIKINSLELENVKRIKAVKLEPSSNGLTVIGGKNAQGKTSVLDAIAWALGGESFAPTKPQREGSMLAPNLKVTLSNGIIVERTGKNSSLKVTDPNGNKAGQNLLNSFIEKLALNLPKFMNSSNKEKANTLLQIIGLEQQVAALELKEKELYNKRLAIGQIADQKEKFAKEMISYPNVPEDLISVSELIKQQQEILARNGENERLRQKAFQLSAERNSLAEKVNALSEELKRYQALLIEKDKEVEIAYKTSEELKDESTEELENNIRNIEEINVKVRTNLDKEKAEEDAKEYADQYTNLTLQIEDVRKEKYHLLNNASLPLPGLSVEDGELTYNGQKWDNMSGSEQLKVATSIVRKVNPECGFVLMDKLEQMDIDTMNEFGQWLESEGLQVIATRVSTGEECSVIIEDGYVANQEESQSVKKWEGGF